MYLEGKTIKVKCLYCGHVCESHEQGVVYFLIDNKRRERTVKTYCPKCGTVDTMEDLKE